MEDVLTYGVILAALAAAVAVYIWRGGLEDDGENRK